MSEHSRLSASSSSRWIKCAGSIKMSEGVDQPPPHPSALEGTVAHKICEQALTAHLNAQEFNYDELIGTTTDEILIDREMLNSVKIFVEFVTGLLSPGDTLKLEQRVSLSYLHKDLWGTSDVIIEHASGSISVVDFKYGKWGVAAKDNSQMIYYFLGARDDRNISIGNLHIVQPRSSDGKKIKSWAIDKDGIAKWENIFRSKAIEADLGTPINKGDWCRFCPGKIKCPLHKTTA